MSDLLDFLTSRAVVPLVVAKTAPKPIRDLHPTFDIDGVAHVMVTHQIGSILARELKRPVMSLRHERDTITRALDHLFQGF
eukprot:gene5520-5574_t